MAKSVTDGVPSVGTMGKFWYVEAGVGFGGVVEKKDDKKLKADETIPGVFCNTVP